MALDASRAATFKGEAGQDGCTMERHPLLRLAVVLVLAVLFAGCVNSTTGSNGTDPGADSDDLPNSSVNSSIADDLENASDEEDDSGDSGAENPFQSLMENASDEEDDGPEAASGGDDPSGDSSDGGDGSTDGDGDASDGEEDPLEAFGSDDGDTGASISAGEQTGLRVVDVPSADTVRVRFENGSTASVRLVGVKAPPTEGPVLTDSYKTIDNIRREKECVRQWGQRAQDHVAEDLMDSEVEIEYDSQVANTKKYIGHQAYLIVDGQNYNRGLIEEGYVRTFEEGFSRQLEFKEAEKRARRDAAGLWQCASGSDGGGDDQGIVVSDIQPEVPEGTDQKNLNEEWVELKNTGNTTIEMTGWTVHTEGSRSYNFPDGFELRPGSTVKVRSGNSFSFRSSEQHATDLYWGSISPVWPNDGGTVLVRDASFSVRDEYGY